MVKDQDRKLVVLLRLTTEAVFKVRKKEFRKYGISLEEWAVLSITHSVGEKTTPAEISRWMFRQHHSVTALLSRMEKRGLIKKTKDLERKNMVRVTITEKGEQIYRVSRRAKAHRQIASDLSKAERQQLMKYLDIIRNRSFKELGISYKTPFP